MAFVRFLGTVVLLTGQKSGVADQIRGRIAFVVIRPHGCSGLPAALRGDSGPLSPKKLPRIRYPRNSSAPRLAAESLY